MFNENQKLSIAKSIDMSKEELNQFVKRFKGHLESSIKKGPLTTNTILNGLRIASSVKKESLIDKQQKREAIEFGLMRNELIKKYAVKILELRDIEKYGAQRISTYLKVHHKVTISKATIDRFLKLNKGSNNG